MPVWTVDPARVDLAGRSFSLQVPQNPHPSLVGTGDFARAVSGGGDSIERMQRAVELVVELVEGCDHAGVTIARDHHLETPAASDELVRLGDAWQYELGEGPCVESVASEHTIISQDLARDPRWPRWSSKVQTSLGIRAMMSLLIFTERDTYGALNCYADHPDAWDDESISLAYALAGHLAVSVADAREIDHRGRAMVSRTVIGQAEGILMERFSLSGDQAFAYLRRMSQTTHQKLTAVAEQLVHSRRLPEGQPDA